MGVKHANQAYRAVSRNSSNNKRSTFTVHIWTSWYISADHNFIVFLSNKNKTAWRSYLSMISTCRYVLSSLSSVVGDDRETVGDFSEKIRLGS